MLETEFESRGLSEPLLGNSSFLSEFLKNLLNVNKEAILFNEVEFLPLIVAERTEDCLCARKQSYRAGWKLILSILILNDMNLKTGSWG